MCRTIPIVLASMLVAYVSCAQNPPGSGTKFVNDTLAIGAEVHAFEDAVSVSSDPLGNVFVVDRSASTVTRFSVKGTQTVFGGPGSGEGQFYNPQDLDPTTGFLFLVADAGNGRIQRLGTDFVYIESLSVGGGTRRKSGLPVSRGSLEEITDMYPVAVTSSPDGNVFAYDSTSSRVLQWNANRQLVNAWKIGSGREKRTNPGEMIVHGNRLFMSDAVIPRVIAFDLFGNELYSFGTEVLSNPVALELVNDQLVVLDSGRFVFFSLAGVLNRITTITTDRELVDFTVNGRGVYFISAGNLFFAER